MADKAYQHTKNIQLYDYRQDMRERIEAEFKSHRSLMVQMPTGTGKTYLLAAVVLDYIRQTGGYVWIVTHRRELVQQVRETLRKFRQYAQDDEAFKKHAVVYSIQWLSRHYDDVSEIPVMIIVDEAHHAVAKTYSSVVNAYPKAKVLGLTATPCRLSGEPFTDLFERLLQSWTVNRFIAKGYLSLYDYMSVRPDNDDINIIRGLKKRGADGDFSVREMAEKLDIRPSLQRLCDTVLRYAKGKKGIVYAISIQHAEHIAEFYRENGIKAVAISSKTPVKVREDVVRRFKKTPMDNTMPLTEDDIQVVVNCELWGEGWDVPDAEFIQLARPTLSLSKYLQMVGRGLRVYDGKKYCLILDNVGSYRLFGLPSDDRDWQKMFEGRMSGKGVMPKTKEREIVSQGGFHEGKETDSARTEMVMLINHDGQRSDLDVNYGYKVSKDGNGNYGIVDKKRKIVLPYEYEDIEIKDNGTAHLHSVQNGGSVWSWIDLINGVRFDRRPVIVRNDWVELSTSDNRHFYPRISSKWMSSKVYAGLLSLKYGLGDGLYAFNYFIQPSEPRKLYRYVESFYGKTLYKDESGDFFEKYEYELPLKRISYNEWEKRKQDFEEDIKAKNANGRVDSNLRHKEEKLVEIGFLKFYEFRGLYSLFYNTSVMLTVHNTFFLPILTRNQIRMRDGICFLGEKYIMMASRPHVIFHIVRTYYDERWFDLEYSAYPSGRLYSCELFYDGKVPQIMSVVRYKDGL